MNNNSAVSSYCDKKKKSQREVHRLAKKRNEQRVLTVYRTLITSLFKSVRRHS